MSEGSLFAVDQLDWAAVRSSFTEEVEIDYTSLFGGEPEHLQADVLVDRWRSLLPGFDATQHLTGPVIVTSAGATEAVAETHVRGYHCIDEMTNGVWMVAGHYVMPMRRIVSSWKVAGIPVDVHFSHLQWQIQCE